MGDRMSYNKVGWRFCRGRSRRRFRLSPRRFCVHRIRIKFMYLIKLLSRWRSACGNAMNSLKKRVDRSSSCGGGGGRRRRREESSSVSRRNLVSITPDVNRGDHCRLRSYGRSNSFYSEAIADCLEFIKRSSISLDEYKPVNQI